MRRDALIVIVARKCAERGLLKLKENLFNDSRARRKQQKLCEFVTFFNNCVIMEFQEWLTFGFVSQIILGIDIVNNFKYKLSN
jgi:hypothetical protein